MPKEIPDRLRAVCEWFPAAEAKNVLGNNYTNVLAASEFGAIWPAYWTGNGFKAVGSNFSLFPCYFCLMPTTPIEFDRQQAEKRRRDEAGTPELFVTREPT